MYRSKRYLFHIFWNFILEVKNPNPWKTCCGFPLFDSFQSNRKCSKFVQKVIKRLHFLNLNIPQHVLRWLDRLKNDEIHQRYDVFENIIFKILEHLQAFWNDLPNLPLDECKIQGKYTVIFFLRSNSRGDGCLKSESDQKWRSVSININDTL